MPGLKPRPLAPESSALTMKPPRLPQGKQITVTFYFIYLLFLYLLIFFVLSFCLSFYFFSAFVEPASNVFRVTW